MTKNAIDRLIIDCLTQTHHDAAAAYRLALRRVGGDADAAATVTRIAYALGVDVLLTPWTKKAED